VIVEEGTQQSAVAAMQTRARLYELLDYEAYNSFDSSVYNFTLDGHGA
jgi:methylisocitrate lyase